jgi:hypothetical protein
MAQQVPRVQKEFAAGAAWEVAKARPPWRVTLRRGKQ